MAISQSDPVRLYQHPKLNMLAAKIEQLGDRNKAYFLLWLIYIAGSRLGSLLRLRFLYYTNTTRKGSESGSEPM